ncbi:MAG TPA: hypothetical protein VMY43_13395 [Methanothrix sp.]|nr:hypothetical protein [Methanothrix sp.]
MKVDYPIVEVKEMIEVIWKKLIGFKLSRGDSMIVGSFIGFLMASYYTTTFLHPSNQYQNLTLMADYQWLYATGTAAVGLPWLLLLGTGLFLKDK